MKEKTWVILWAVTGFVFLEVCWLLIFVALRGFN